MQSHACLRLLQSLGENGASPSVPVFTSGRWGGVGRGEAVWCRWTWGLLICDSDSDCVCLGDFLALYPRWALIVEAVRSGERRCPLPSHTAPARGGVRGRRCPRVRRGPANGGRPRPRPEPRPPASWIGRAPPPEERGRPRPAALRFSWARTLQERQCEPWRAPCCAGLRRRRRRCRCGEPAGRGGKRGARRGGAPWGGGGTEGPGGGWFPRREWRVRMRGVGAGRG